MENIGIASFYRICLLTVIVAMPLLIMKILCVDESLISVFYFLYKAVVYIYYSTSLPIISFIRKKIVRQSMLH